jgi:uncharacterized protein
VRALIRRELGWEILYIPVGALFRRPSHGIAFTALCALRASSESVPQAAAPGGFADPDLDAQDRLIRLNVTAVTRLAGAVTPRFLAEGGGAIINIASVLALAPEVLQGIYAATKAFVLTFSQSLQAELGPQGLYVQAVLPGATRTEIWARSGRDAEAIPGMMDVDELVDAALVGFDRRETVTIPPLPDIGQWRAFSEARQAMLPNFRQEHAAARYHA